MSIKNFEQFINESVEVNKERLCNNEAMNDAYSKLLELSRQSFEKNIEKLTLQLKLIERAIEMIKEKYGDHIVGEPIEIDITHIETHDGLYSGMEEITMDLNTDLPNIEYENYYDDFVELEKNINYLFDLEYNYEYVGWEDKLSIDLGLYDDFDPLKISINVSGINTMGLISICGANDTYHKKYKEELNKILYHIYKNSKN